MPANFTVGLLLAGLSACGKPGQPVTVKFAGMVGSQPFSCGTQYAGLGSTTTTWTPQDFRLYVHDVSLIDSSGSVVPVELAQNTPWQTSNVALLDFEDATAGCANGTPETNDLVTGTVESGHTWTGLQFKVGVPFNLDHLNDATAPSPLDQSALFWDWLDGYKFIRIEGATTGQPMGYAFHLGSTDCAVDGSGNTTSCQNPNRPVITLTAFDPAVNTVAADLAGLFAGVNLDTETAPPGCLSDPLDPDCGQLFANVGLPFGSTLANPGAQKFFRVQ